MRNGTYRGMPLCALLGVALWWGAAAIATPAAHGQRRGGAAEPSAADYKLKKGGTGAVCLGCHTSIAESIKKKSVHSPIKRGVCTGCHSPHASSHGVLLAAEPEAVCGTCHDMLPKDAASTHAPAAEGKCRMCHEVHAADDGPLLTKPQAALCATCHGSIVREAAAAKVKHRPVQEDGCATCHDPHASKTGDALLKKSMQDLCTGCHKADTASFTKKHMDYPVAEAACTSCHNPHGSNQPGMLHDDVHPPVAKRNCAQCHDPPSSRRGVTVKKSGVELCKTCHSKEVKKLTAKSRVHWALLDAKACLNCHNPHASSGDKLVDKNQGRVCATCHPDTIARYERSPAKHKPVANDCAKCHDPHASDGALLLKQADVNKLCGTCHKWQQHSSHPIGVKFKDPRNRNLRLNCLSCHRSHGTENEKMLLTPTITETCVQCHEKFRR